MVLSTMIFNAVIKLEEFEKVVVDFIFYSEKETDIFQRQIQNFYKQITIQKSDVDLILDEYLMLPETIGDEFSITNLDLVSSLSTRFPAFSKRLTVPTIGKMMVERGFEATRKGKNRLSCYLISKHSKVLELLENDSQTWQLMVEPFIDSVCKK